MLKVVFKMAQLRAGRKDPLQRGACNPGARAKGAPVPAERSEPTPGHQVASLIEAGDVE